MLMNGIQNLNKYIIVYKITIDKYIIIYKITIYNNYNIK